MRAELETATKQLDNAQLDYIAATNRVRPTPVDIADAKQSVDSRGERYKKLSEENSGLLYSGDYGVNEAFFSSVSISSVTGGGNAVEVNAYQYSIPLWKVLCEKNTKTTIFFRRLVVERDEYDECNGDQYRDSYSLMPMYLLIHKTVTNAQTPATDGAKLATNTLTNDLLNNENGGLLNIKFAPSFREGNLLGERDPYVPHYSVIGDFGYKHIEQPTSDLKGTTYASGGYVGMGVNMEFSILDNNADIAELALKNIKPAGHLAVGVGYYRNRVSGFDGTFFTSPVPKYFNTIAVGGELQITNLISAMFSHSVPKMVADPNPLGQFTSISIKIQN